MISLTIAFFCVLVLGGKTVLAEEDPKKPPTITPAEDVRSPKIDDRSSDPSGWNDKSVGPSKFWQELIPETFVKAVHDANADNYKDAVVLFYADRNVHSQELMPTQEKAARKVLDETRVKDEEFRFLLNSFCVCG